MRSSTKSPPHAPCIAPCQHVVSMLKSAVVALEDTCPRCGSAEHVALITRIRAAVESWEDSPPGSAAPTPQRLDRHLCLRVSIPDLHRQLILVDSLLQETDIDNVHDLIVNNVDLLNGLVNMLTELEARLEAFGQALVSA